MQSIRFCTAQARMQINGSNNVVKIYETTKIIPEFLYFLEQCCTAKFFDEQFKLLFKHNIYSLSIG